MKCAFLNNYFSGILLVCLIGFESNLNVKQIASLEVLYKGIHQ